MPFRRQISIAAVSFFMRCLYDMCWTQHPAECYTKKAIQESLFDGRFSPVSNKLLKNKGVSVP